MVTRVALRFGLYLAVATPLAVLLGRLLCSECLPAEGPREFARASEARSRPGRMTRKVPVRGSVTSPNRQGTSSGRLRQRRGARGD